jgi:hypothetical protein
MILQLMQESVHILGMETARLPAYPYPIEEDSMFTHAVKHPRATLTLALLAVTLAAAAPAGADQIESSADGLHYGTSAVTAAACNGSKLAGPADRWVEANGVGVESGDVRRMSFSFSDPVATDTFHFAMNEVGGRNLALIEVQDGNGAWHKVREGALPGTAPGFATQCFEQKLAQKQVLRALRLSFRPAPGDIEVDRAALLRR